MYDIFAGLVEGLDFRPTLHLNYENAMLPIKDGLPKFRDMPEALRWQRRPDGGMSAPMPDAAPLIRLSKPG